MAMAMAIPMAMSMPMSMAMAMMSCQKSSTKNIAKYSTHGIIKRPEPETVVESLKTVEQALRSEPFVSGNIEKCSVNNLVVQSIPIVPYVMTWHGLT